MCHHLVLAKNLENIDCLMGSACARYLLMVGDVSEIEGINEAIAISGANHYKYSKKQFPAL